MESGAWLAVWGLFKKVVVADNLALLVNGAFGAEGVSGARDADLLRFFGVQRHRAGGGADDGFWADGEFPVAVFREEPKGVLGEVAHQFVAVVAELRLHSAGREPAGSGAADAEFVRDDVAGRVVARGGVDVRGVGEEGAGGFWAVGMVAAGGDVPFGGLVWVFFRAGSFGEA